MVRYEKAVEMVGKALGESKFNNHMGGSMLPRGELSPGQILEIIYGVDADIVESILKKLSQKEFDRIREYHFKSAR